MGGEDNLQQNEHVERAEVDDQHGRRRRAAHACHSPIGACEGGPRCHDAQVRDHTAVGQCAGQQANSAKSAKSAAAGVTARGAVMVAPHCYSCGYQSDWQGAQQQSAQQSAQHVEHQAAIHLKPNPVDGPPAGLPLREHAGAVGLTLLALLALLGSVHRRRPQREQQGDEHLAGTPPHKHRRIATKRGVAPEAERCEADEQAEKHEHKPSQNMNGHVQRSRTARREDSYAHEHKAFRHRQQHRREQGELASHALRLRRR